MNLPQFLKSIDSCADRMTKTELAAVLHEIARILPEEHRNWLLSVIKQYAGEKAESEPEQAHSADLYEVLDRISSGEYCLDSSLNEEWDDWYNSEEPEFLFEDNDGLLDSIAAACAELHQLTDSAAYAEAYQLGETLLTLKVQVDGEYLDYNNDFMTLEKLDDYNLLSVSLKGMLLDMACAAYFVKSGTERLKTLYQLGNCLHICWTMEELMQHTPQELPDTEQFLSDWIAWLKEIPETNAQTFLQEALCLQNDAAKTLETARQSAALHPEVYALALSMQEDDASRLSVGLEALQNISVPFVVRSEIALQTAEAAQRLGEDAKAADCRTEAFRSNSTPMNFLRALLYAPDYDKALAELQDIADSFQMQETQNRQKQNQLSMETRYFLQFLNGKQQKVYLPLQKTYNRYDPQALCQGAALTALFLYTGETLREGGKAMCRYLANTLPFDSSVYRQGLAQTTETDSLQLLWNCLCQCRQHTPLTDTVEAFAFLRKFFNNFTAYVMEENHRNLYTKCAELAAVIGEILEAEDAGRKNEFLLECKAQYPRRTAYHRELRIYGMRDGKK